MRWLLLTIPDVDSRRRVTARFTEDGGFGLALDTLGPLHWAGIVLATVTAVVHLYLFAIEDWLPFLLAGVGFLVAVGLLVFNVRRAYLYPAGIAYTVAQIVGYLLLPLGPLWLGVLDKAVQVALVAVLGYLYWAEVMDRGQRSVTGAPKARSESG